MLFSTLQPLFSIPVSTNMQSSVTTASNNITTGDGSEAETSMPNIN